MARKKGLSFTACCGSGFALAAVAVAVILIAASFRTLDATTYGLAYDSLWCTIDRTTLYNNGLFFVGPTTVFLTFPKATRDVYDTLPARTRDGLRIELELSFQYRLQQNADALADLPGVSSINLADGVLVETITVHDDGADLVTRGNLPA